MSFNENNKIKFIVFASLVTLIFIIVGIFMFSKLECKSKDKLDIGKDIKSAKQAKINGNNGALQMKVIGNEKREKELEKFQDKYKENPETNQNNVNASKERRTSNGEFYIDNSGDLYSNNIVSLDDRFRIENRLKDAANDMENVYSETLAFNKDDNKLKQYLSEGDNKSRFSYLYGISDQNNLKNFISKLGFLESSKINYGILSNIKKVDDNNITFEFRIITKDNINQIFNVSINFANERAILNIKVA